MRKSRLVNEGTSESTPQGVARNASTIHNRRVRSAPAARAAGARAPGANNAPRQVLTVRLDLDDSDEEELFDSVEEDFGYENPY